MVFVELLLLTFVVPAFCTATHGGVLLLQWLWLKAIYPFLRMLVRALVRLCRWLAKLMVSFSRRGFARRIRQTKKREICVYLIPQFFAWIIYFKYLWAPGSVYGIAFFSACYVLIVAPILLVVIFKYLGAGAVFEQGLMKLVAALVFGFFLYCCHCAASEWMATLFPFSPLNVRLATAAATVLFASKMLSVVFMCFALGFEVAAVLPIVIHEFKRKDAGPGVTVGVVFLFSFLSAWTLVNVMKNASHTRLADILVANIAFDFDSMGVSACALSNADQQAVKSGYKAAVIPVFTSLEKGYLMVLDKRMPDGVRMPSYATMDTRPYIPRMIGFVDCTKVPAPSNR